VGTGIKFPTYDARVDGNIFEWVLIASQDFREIRQRQRYVEFKEAAEKSQSVDRSKVEN
jgi:hypothetical protein